MGHFSRKHPENCNKTQKNTPLNTNDYFFSSFNIKCNENEAQQKTIKKFNNQLKNNKIKNKNKNTLK